MVKEHQPRVLHLLKVHLQRLIQRNQLLKMQARKLRKRTRDHYQSLINMSTMKLDHSCCTTRVIDLSTLDVTSQHRLGRDQSKKRKQWLSKDKRKENKPNSKLNRNNNAESNRKIKERSSEKLCSRETLKTREISTKRR